MNPRAIKNERIVLNALASAGQAKAAIEIGVDESTISTWKSGTLKKLCHLLAFLGLKLVPETHKCVRAEEFDHVMWLAQKGMESLKSAEDLIYEDTE